MPMRYCALIFAPRLLWNRNWMLGSNWLVQNTVRWGPPQSIPASPPYSASRTFATRGRAACSAVPRHGTVEGSGTIWKWNDTALDWSRCPPQSGVGLRAMRLAGAGRTHPFASLSWQRSTTARRAAKLNEGGPDDFRQPAPVHPTIGGAERPGLRRARK